MAEAGPQTSFFTLSNGLEVVVIPDRRAPVVTHMIWYRVGGADEPKGKSGIAHFLEHLMFKGTHRQPKGFSLEVAERGGQENAFTGNDYTAYFQRVSKDHLGAMMAFEADRMTGLVLSDEVVNPERDVVLEERKMRVDNDPSSQLGEEVAASLFTHHPYGIPIIGWQDEIETLDRHDALEFYRRFYTPKNAILIVAGDVEADAVKALAEQSWGKVPSTMERPERKRPKEPPQRADRRVSIAHERVEQPALQRHWRVPGYRTGEPGEAEALEVLAQVLGGGPTSRLYRALVADQKIAANAGTWYGGTSVDEGRFVAYATPREGVSFETVEQAMDAVIATIAQEGITRAELDRAVTRLVADAVYAQDSQTSLARQYGASLAVGLTIADVEEWPSRMKAVTADAVQQAAAKHLVAMKSVVGLLSGKA